MKVEKLIRQTFKAIFDHARDKVVTNIIEANSKGRTHISKEDLKALSSLVSASFDQAYSQTGNQIEKVAAEISKE